MSVEAPTPTLPRRRGRDSEGARAVVKPTETPSEPYEIELSLGFLAHRLAETLEARLMARLQPEGLTLPAYRILAVLLGCEECRSVDLAERAGIEPPTVSRLVGSLRERGLVTRRRSGSDARTVRIWLTRKGRALAERLTAVSRRSEQDTLAALSSAEAGDFLAALVRVREAALAALPGPGPGISRIKSKATRPGFPLRG
jgi:DNA-binding MarR family transcriptional regulator